MFIDEVEIILKAGHGGPGKVSFYKVSQKGPDGGDGGKGGDLYVAGSNSHTDLHNYFKKHQLSAENGAPGESNLKSGKKAADLELKMPVGTILEDINTGEIFELTSDNQKLLLCKGGLGGRGNFQFRSPSNTTPMYAQPGLPGQERQLKIYLKLIADIGLIGLPNSGKSSLLNELTSANVKVGNFAFTTLEPNLGVSQGKVLADIPGLIEGASSGKGLGIKFLKHIEKTKLLFHCVSSESEDILKDISVVNNELGQYNQALLEKPQLILITKSDLLTPEKKTQTDKKLKKLKQKFLFISIYDWESVKILEELIKNP